MTAVSIVIPAYNNAKYLSMCLDSLRQQTFDDFEVVVVDDASKDNTVEVVRKHMKQDSRIMLVRQERNQGTLVARKTGALHTHGEFVTFMDQDDDLVPRALELAMAQMKESPVDILHFSVKVDSANDLAQGAAAGMAAYMTPKPRSLSGDEILLKVFGEDGYDWNVHHKLYRGNLLRKAMQSLKNVRLTRPDDAYIYFAIASSAKTYRAVPDSAWYIYHLGRGVTLGDALSLATLTDISDQDAMALQLVNEYIPLHHDVPAAYQAATDLHDRLIEHTMNEWHDNVGEAMKTQALTAIQSSWDNVSIAAELYRFLRDSAYTALQRFKAGESIDKDEQEICLYRAALQQVDVSRIYTSNKRFTSMRHIAESHMHDLQRQQRLHRWNNQSIRIFVTTHKDVDVPKSDILQPVQVGSKAQRFDWAWQDDEGENISDKNPMYCELTTQYWAWKNVDADYYGFCHYRRYFDFADIEHEENAYGEIIDDFIDVDAVKRYGLDDQTIAKSIEGYDVVTTRYGNLEKIIDKHGSPWKVWESAPLLHDEDLNRCYQILCKMHPDYQEDASAFLKGNRSCFCNMFIMKKKIFFDYCAWLFPILEEFEKQTDMSKYSKEALRTPGHLSERLLNIWLMHHERIAAGTDFEWKSKELQCVHFTNPEPEQPLQMLGAEVNHDAIIPVVFAADNNYVPQLTTTIYSAMKNASPDRFYDVVVLQRDISGDNQDRMRRFLSRFANMNLRFANVDRLMSGYELSTNNEHISVETYYRFLIQQLLPFYDKVLYLDSDIIINGDISQLFDIELGDTLLGAVRDIDFLGNLNVKHGLRMGYAKNVLKMNDPYAYFQAGVLVLNTKAMRERYTIKQWLGYASNPEFIYNDQDVLNAHCEGEVTYLPWEWNVVHDCGGRVGNLFTQAPNDIYDAYMDSRNHPQIIHYAGFQKPWTDPDCDFAPVYWNYARDTPFYERLLKRAFYQSLPAIVSQPPVAKPPRAVGEHNPLRKIIDPIAPLGSNRREMLKAMGRMIRGRH